MKQEEQYPKCCGTCAFFKFEDIDGDGTCIKNILDVMANCSNEPCNDYISTEEQRHNLATLLLLSRWMQDPHSRRPIAWEEIMRAIDFACNMIKTVSNL